MQPWHSPLGLCLASAQICKGGGGQKVLCSIFPHHASPYRANLKLDSNRVYWPLKAFSEGSPGGSALLCVGVGCGGNVQTFGKEKVDTEEWSQGGSLQFTKKPRFLAPVLAFEAGDLTARQMEHLLSPYASMVRDQDGSWPFHPVCLSLRTRKTGQTGKGNPEGHPCQSL